MKNETIGILEKIKITKSTTNKVESSGCCGGAPSINEEACCQLDEEKKAEGESGCGCATSSESKVKSSCC